MKKIFTMMLASVFMAGGSSMLAGTFAEDWAWRHPNPTANSLNDVKALGGGKFVMAGDDGYVAISNEKGYSWTEINMKTNEDFVLVAPFALSGDCSLITETGVVFSSNGTLHYALKDKIGKEVNLNAETQFDGKYWLVGDDGVILSSADGNEWTTINAGISDDINTIYYYNNEARLGTENGGVYVSKDNGTSWTKEVSTCEASVNDFYFVDENTGFAACNDGYIIKTTNSGALWDTLKTGQNYSNYNCYFLNPIMGIASCEFGNMLMTVNGGNSWTQIPTGALGSLVSFDYDSEGNLVVVSTNGEVLAMNINDALKGQVTINNVSKVSTSFNLRSIAAVNNKVLAVGDNGTAILSEDNGVTWKKLTTDNSDRITACGFFGADTAYFVTNAGDLYRSLDGGDTWKTQTTDNDKAINDLCISGTNGYFVGNKTQVFYTSNSGKKWAQGVVLTSSAFDIYGVCADGTTAWVCGANGKIAKTTSGGETWDLCQNPNSEKLNAISVKGNIGYAVGENRTLLITIDGGNNWNKVSQIDLTGLDDQLEFTDVYMHDDGKSAFLVGEDGSVFRTIEAGPNGQWEKIIITSDYNIYAIGTKVENNEFVAWICGGNGMIMSHGIALSSVEDEISVANDNSLKLYPNPVSDIVNIELQNNDDNFANIEICDESGNIVLSLSNVAVRNKIIELNLQELSAGFYMIRVMANNKVNSVNLIKK